MATSVKTTANPRHPAIESGAACADELMEGCFQQSRRFGNAHILWWGGFLGRLFGFCASAIGPKNVLAVLETITANIEELAKSDKPEKTR